MNYNELLSIAKEAAVRAGEAILEVYEAEDRGIELKSDDSPLTLADKNAHNVIVEYLEETKLPVLSEEGASIPFNERSNWEKFWMVDPLDGTKEFIKRNGEFTVNIALIENGISTLGVVYIPITKELYSGNVHDQKAYVSADTQEEELISHKSERSTQWSVAEGNIAQCQGDESIPVRIVCSRSHMNDETKGFIQQFENTSEVPKGSSLKFLKIAENQADVYPRFGPTMEWDTAAAHAVISACGYHIKQVDSLTELQYNKENLLNPFFIAF
ncbi:MAG: 3'(2'),5'-bisphosphate nucleotidase CysQ [Flavobacteriales bacterium]